MNNEGYYRGKRFTNEEPSFDNIDYLRRLLGDPGDSITSTSTESSLSGHAIEENEDSCKACHAPYGHFGHCPRINRASAEAHSTIANPSDIDIIFARGLGVDFTQ